MMNKTTFATTLACMLAVAMPAAAQQTTDNLVAANTDWSTFEAENPRECISVSAPTSSTLTDGNGNPTTGTRGDIYLMVFYRPGANVQGQVTFTGGYPFASGSTVDLTVGDSTFQLFTEGEWAWPATPEDDARVVAALKRGADAVVRGRSGRGNITTDTFSLLGFTAGVEEAENRCAS
ncbi:hypothetical protein SAMN05428995_101149 [Loktanella sp. DSM 29012]|uniref:invasion associated locus B family protein n=1 Tax=Loktanella sp. DSM 29012 TaxID=1881056 RepID=UPI0008BCF8BC|nr:invasion associated locus B family protein [Loktanella sp. DSM 29012]SEP57762.1 hypothetical protein SAMN05428995_101149 [Loktanella sp. DSM 29012]